MNEFRTHGKLFTQSDNLNLSLTEIFNWKSITEATTWFVELHRNYLNYMFFFNLINKKSLVLIIYIIKLMDFIGTP